MNKKITRLALAGKCGVLGASGFGAGAARASNPAPSSSDASAITPKPPPARRRNSRRLAGHVGHPLGPQQRLGSVDIDKSVQVEERAAKLLKRGMIRCVTLMASRQELTGQGAFLRRGRPANDQAKGALDLLVG